MVVALILFFLYYIAILLRSVTTINIENPLKGSKNVHFYSIPDVRRTLVMYVGRNDEIKSVFVTLYGSESSTVTIYNIPTWVYVQEYSDTFEDIVPVKNLLYIGNSINDRRKYEYAFWQIQNISALTFDSYIIINDAADDVSERIYGVSITSLKSVGDYASYFKAHNLLSTLSNPESYNTFTNNIKSNMDRYGVYEYFNTLAAVINDESTLINVSETVATTEKTLVNGSVVKFLDYANVDKQLQANISALQGKKLQKEQVRIEVYNGSSVPRAAERYARFISNSGCLVVRYSNSPDNEKTSKIYVSDEKKYAESLRVVKEIFVQPPEVIVGRPNFLSTGDIVVVLGEDLKNEVSWVAGQ